MALPPHWLDDFFHTTPPEKWWHDLHRTPRLYQALETAQQAYDDHVAFMREHPDIIGSYPAQKARLAFLAEISKP